MKKTIGDFVVESILQSVSKLKSPVIGGKYKKTLSKDYKKIKSKIAPGVPNMELRGSMLDALTFKQRKDSVEVGIFNFKQAQKSDNHNKFSGASKLTKVPERQFIPRPGQKFKKTITAGIDKVLKKNLEPPIEPEETEAE